MLDMTDFKNDRSGDQTRDFTHSGTLTIPLHHRSLSTCDYMFRILKNPKDLKVK